jgi:small subunit ribosomal protein S17
MPKRVEVGVVTGDKMEKTRRVEIPRLVKHAKYGKYLRRRTVCYAHDEDNLSRAGDTVEIIESRPMSRKKRWQLVRVVSKSRLAGVAAMPEAGPLEPAQDGLGAEGLGIGNEERGIKD